MNFHIDLHLHGVSELVHEHQKLTKILHLLESLMSAISDFAAKQNAFNDQMDNAVSGLTDDVKNLNDQIAALQASNGSITAEDQKLLDGIQARSQAIADKLTALDNMTPPKPPVA